MATALQIQTLRAQIGALDGSRKSDGFTSQFVAASLPRGAVVEVIGPARTELMVKLLVEAQSATPTALSLWVEGEFSIYPLGLQQQGIDLSRLLFVESNKAANWVLGQALQTQLFPVVIASDFQFDEKDMRRFQLLSERGRATTFLLSEERRPSWVPQMVVEATHEEGRLHVEVLRQRGLL